MSDYLRGYSDMLYSGSSGCSTVAKQALNLEEKLSILSDAAKYDVACTSSGVDRKGQKGMLGNSCAAGICHSFAADGRCISLLKILMTNHCEYDCKYCVNRRSNDVRRATFESEEICKLTIEFYKRNYIEGLFLSSAVIKSPEYTMEKMCETLRLLRGRYHFNGYIHVKTIPGAPSELIYSAGLLADRISVNMELPSQEGLKRLAPSKSMLSIMTPMAQITNTIAGNRLATGKSAYMERSRINEHLPNGIFSKGREVHQLEGECASSRIIGGHNSEDGLVSSSDSLIEPDSIKTQAGQFYYPADPLDSSMKRPFASAGQSTQMIVGATDETDLSLIRTSQKLYQAFDLKRVFYSAYIPINDDDALPSLETPVPLLREHRLYQADWLLRFYGFNADELLSEKEPNFNEQIDPKCNWAINNLGQFPIEVNTASAAQLLRVPGIGPKSVQRIIRQRRYGRLNFAILKKIGVVLKRAQYFITCDGKMLYRIPFEQSFILRELTSVESRDNYRITHGTDSYTQMNLFSDFGLGMG